MWSPNWLTHYRTDDIHVYIYIHHTLSISHYEENHIMNATQTVDRQWYICSFSMVKASLLHYFIHYFHATNSMRSQYMEPPIPYNTLPLCSSHSPKVVLARNILFSVVDWAGLDAQTKVVVPAAANHRQVEACRVPHSCRRCWFQCLMSIHVHMCVCPTQ